MILDALNRGAVEIDGIRYIVTMVLDAYGQEMLCWELYGVLGE